MPNASKTAKRKTPLRRKRIDQCPSCGSRLLFVEGASHYVREVEVDEDGGIHAVEFASVKQVPYHSTTWLECDENCYESQEQSIECAIFDDEEDNEDDA